MKTEHITTVVFVFLALLVASHWARHRSKMVRPSDVLETVPQAADSNDKPLDDSGPFYTPLYLRYNTPLSKTFFKWAGLPLLEQPKCRQAQNTI